MIKVGKLGHWSSSETVIEQFAIRRLKEEQSTAAGNNQDTATVRQSKARNTLKE